MSDLCFILAVILIGSVLFLIYINIKARNGKGKAIAHRKRGLFSGSKNGAYYEFKAKDGKIYTAFLSNWRCIGRPEKVIVQYDTDNPRLNRIVEEAEM